MTETITTETITNETITNETITNETITTAMAVHAIDLARLEQMARTLLAAGRSRRSGYQPRDRVAPPAQEPPERQLTYSVQEEVTVVNERSTEAAAAVSLTNWDTTSCPECGAIAEVLDRVPLRSTDGWIEHVKIRCVAKHWFFMPVGL